MAWSSSDRRAHLPRNWQAIRKSILKRDGWRCRIHGPQCELLANEVDHMGSRDDHRPEVLQAVCSTCHTAKTNADAKAAQSAIRGRGKRPPEPHPGIA